MHKNPHQNAGNGITETLFFKIFLGSMAPDPPPPKIAKPVRLCQGRSKAFSFFFGGGYIRKAFLPDFQKLPEMFKTYNARIFIIFNSALPKL